MREPSQASDGTVIVYPVDEHHYNHEHEKATRLEIARRIAALKGFRFGGIFQAGAVRAGPHYFVPSDTLVGSPLAAELGIRGPQDLFGGVVPFAFAATKVITHSLGGSASAAPAGWSNRFGQLIQGAVLSGWSAFTIEDARMSGKQLLEKGPVRLKAARATGGRGQVLIADRADLDRSIDALNPVEVAAHGVVLEEHLAEVTTFSVGQVQIAGLMATYFGTQHLAHDNASTEVYGGSTLVCVRGGFDALLAMSLSDEIRLAVAQARKYDAAATACFPEMILSRRNYDVIRGRDTQGRWQSGVLEQSWRMGGATGAELAALEAFRADPALQVVRAASIEAYGEGAEAPPHATVYFRGLDPQVGWITKYAVVQSYGDA